MGRVCTLNIRTYWYTLLSLFKVSGWSLHLNGGSKGQKTSFPKFYHELQSTAGIVIKALPSPWNVFTPVPLWQCRLQVLAEQGQVLTFSRQPGSLEMCYCPRAPPFYDSSMVLRNSRNWRFEAGSWGAGYSQRGMRDPGRHSLPGPRRAGAVCLQGIAKTHLLTQACVWVAALWRLPSPRSESPGSSGIISSSLPLHMEGLLLAENCFITGLNSQRIRTLIYSNMMMINIFYKW